MGVESSDVFSQNALTELCGRLFPQRPQRRVEDVTPLNSWQHQVASFRLVWWTPMGWASERLVARRYTSRLSWWRKDDPHKAKREMLLLPWLAEQGIPAPRLCAHEDGPLGQVVITSYVAGEPWWVRSEEMAEAVEPYVDEFARLLSIIHTLGPPKAIRQLLPAISLVDVLDSMQETGQEASDLELLNATRRLLPLVNKQEELPPCLLHGDYHFANVLLKEECISAVLDWEYSALGDPRWDVMNAYVAMVEFNAEAQAKQFLRTYERYSGLTLEDGALWRAAVALQTWALAAWLSNEAAQGRTYDFLMADQLITHYHAHRERALRIIAGEPW
jgi:aminoglycoside phosphotransferase (APT) family kinase protein